MNLKVQRSIKNILLTTQVMFILATSFIIGTVYVLVDLYNLSEDIVYETTIHDADLQAQSVLAFRKLYTNTVAARAHKLGIEVTSDYEIKARSLPLPATLTKMYGKEIGEKSKGNAAYLYSPYPFAESRHSTGLSDQFRKDAWEHLSKNSDKPFYKVEIINNIPVLRYARADLMKPQCIRCHNNYSRSPKKDWETGDLRGVLEIQRPLTTTFIDENRANTTFILIFFLGFFGAFCAAITMFVIARQKRTYLKLIDAKEATEEALNDRTQFVAQMTHEMRTPMNGVLGMLNLLTETELKASQRDMVDTMETCSHSLMKNLDNISDYSLLNRGQIEIHEESFQIRRILDDALFLVSFTSYQHNFDIDLNVDDSVPEFISGDQIRIKQVIINIITNLAKKTSCSSLTVNVSFEIIQSKSYLITSISDKATGITNENIEKALDLNNTNNIGLTIAKQLSSLMNGSLEYKYTKSAESIFTFKIPVTKENEESLKENSSDEIKAFALKHPHQILIVDDNKISQKVARLTLRKLGYESDVAENGEDAINLIKKGETKYTFILMDIRMPNKDGLTTTKEIVSYLEDESPTIVAMTANSTQENIKDCFAAGMDDFLSKPINIEHLKEVLAKKR